MRTNLLSALVPAALLTACATTTPAAKPAPAPAPAAAAPAPASAPLPPVLSGVDCAAAPTMSEADVDKLLDTVLAGGQRSDKERARDVYRHPKETLAFFGLKPSMSVVELWPGAGWYTEVLAPLLRDCGHLASAAPGGEHHDDYVKTLQSQPNVYDKVAVVDVDPKGDVQLAPPGSVDMVLTFRNIHNWVGGGYEQKIYEAAFRALKPGGVFGVVEHRAKPGTDEATSAKTGYIDEAAVIARIEKAGFKLDAKSEVNANPKDTKDYAKGVWTLPPVLRNGDVDKDKYLAIGESDRMTLRFVKPK